MAISRSKKVEIVSELQGVLKMARVLFLIDFTGVKTAKINAFRAALRALGARYEVIKKNLAERAFQMMEFDTESIRAYSGSLAVISAKEDEIEIAKLIANFQKENESVKVVGGFWGKEFLPKEKISFLSRIPSREVMLGQVVGTMASPLSGFVSVLSGNLKKLIFALSGVSKVHGEN